MWESGRTGERTRRVTESGRANRKEHLDRCVTETRVTGERGYIVTH